MNDRLGGTTESLDGGNIRYYGASPDNYIYFNCSDYSNQSSDTCELWRIIGLFEGKVKIIRNEIIGELAWDQDKNIDSSLTTYDNDWTTSSLQILLNQKYYNGDTSGTVTYYSGSSGSTSTSLNMSSIGIKNDLTRNMISEVTWNLGGYDSYDVYSNEIYDYERGETVYTGRPTIWTGKIALAYPSDYGYATDLSNCAQNLLNYNDATCTSINWMKNDITNNGNYAGWLLTPDSGNSKNTFGVGVSGISAGGNASCYALNVAPVLYLNSNIGIGLGDGTSTNPYRLSV